MIGKKLNVSLLMFQRANVKYNGNLDKALKKAMQKHLIEYKNVDPIVYTKAVDSGIGYISEYLQNKSVLVGICLGSYLDHFDQEDDIEMAYITYRYIK